MVVKSPPSSGGGDPTSTFVDEGGSPSVIYQAGHVMASRYEVISILGSGGYAVVYRCRDMELRREVALKLLIRSGPATEARLRREAAVGSTMEHPHLLRLYDFGTHEGTPFITMPVAEGGTLSQKLSVTGPLQFRETYDLCCRILEGLKFLHRHGFVHRDIKPSNIFFDEAGVVRLGDFGIVWSEKDTRYTVEGNTPGTPQYMPPEFLTGQQVTFSSDLWSFGLTVKEMLGIRAFESARPDVPKWFLKWLSGLVQVDPSRRFRDAASALHALRKHRAPPVIVRRRIVAALATAFAAATLILAWRLPEIVQFKSRTADFTKVEGHKVKGLARDGSLSWEVSFPAKVGLSADFDRNPGAAPRFLVLYGGAESRTRPSSITPRAAILSSKGKLLAELDLLREFNPFRGSFDEGFFKAELLGVDDADGDGRPEAFVNCKHNMYPDILYTLTSSTMSLRNALANSGHIHLVIVSKEKSNYLSGAKMTYVIGMNNKMGHQEVAIPFGSPAGFRMSPDMDDFSDASHVIAYVPIGTVNNRSFRDAEVDAEDRLVISSDDGRKITVDKFGRLEKNLKNTSYGTMEAAENYLEIFYLNVRRVRKLILSGRADEAMEWSDDVIKDSHCKELELAARFAFSDAYLDVGDIGKALLVLPADPQKCVNPKTVQLRKARLLNLQGKYGEAVRSALQSRSPLGMNHWYGISDAAAGEILKGAAPKEVWKFMDENYNQYLATPSVNSWLLQSGILRGESPEALELVRGMMRSQDNSLVEYDEKVLFPAMGELWMPFAMIDAGIKGTVLPSKTSVDEALEEEREREYLLLLAFWEYRMGDKKKALTGLKKSFGELRKAAKRDSSALVPYVISSFYFGFASAEAGNKEDAASSLREALRLYPRGPLAEKARSILNRLK